MASQLWRGIIAHDGFAAYHSGEAVDWISTKTAELQSQLDLVPSDKREKYEKEACMALECVGRYAKWAQINDDFEVLKSQVQHRVDLGSCIFQIEVDAIVRREGKLWLQEYKTAKRPLNEDIVEMDPQLTTYLHFLSEALKEPVIGAIYTQIPLQVMKSGPYAGKEVVRYYLHRTPGQIQLFLEETMKQIHDMTTNPSVYRSPTRDCGWGCHYVELCQVEAQGGDADALRTSQFAIKEPTA